MGLVSFVEIVMSSKNNLDRESEDEGKDNTTPAHAFMNTNARQQLERRLKRGKDWRSVYCGCYNYTASPLGNRM
jgi:hypothetical protein